MSAGSKTLAEDTVPDGEPWPTVYCTSCKWRGDMGELRVSEYEDNDMLYCPKCLWLGWVYQ